MSKKKKSAKPTTDPSARDLRNMRAFEMAAGGKTQSEIGEELGLSRQHVNRILNSEEAKRLVDGARSSLMELQGQAVQTLADAMMNRSEDMKTAVVAATTILKGLGVLTEKSEIQVNKPFVLKLLDGGEIQMGVGPAGEDDGNNR